MTARRRVPQPPTQWSLRAWHHADVVVFAFAVAAPGAHRLQALTPAECHIAELLAGGLSHHRIARIRGASSRTVANQTASLFCKLGIHSRAELVALLARG